MIKQLVCHATRFGGLNAWARHQRRRRLLTLCYHNVLPDDAIPRGPAHRNTIGTTTLRRHLEIASRHFTFVSAEQVLAATRGAPLPERAALLTFDDGYAGWHDHAVPLLQRLGVPAVFLVCTGAIDDGAPLWYEELAWIVDGWRDATLPTPDGGTVPATDRRSALRVLNRWLKRLPDDARAAHLDRLRRGDWRQPDATDRAALRKLTWPELTAMARAGFAIGSHTVRHPILSRLTPAALATELRDSRARIEAQLGAPCPLLAYPNGGDDDVSSAVFAAAHAAGYTAAFTTTRPFSTPAEEPLRIGRWSVPPRISPAAFRTLTSGILLERAARG